ncbi:VOC family protein [Thermomonospora cellulosilytica]|uniref:Putative enzyme related to lactoylglutathione lyase n=1 Tax=Thermomonospora cellulosilytica TaxID=1411118 RepID=A0A7W3N3F7_9ACTN|nr:VOC family protein [Thermomonospora cellulosilytica]MBA9006834.1 putative enzyme related to lactoylglutathione lyase [Thermomonospora cellulosilytica]
MFRWVVAFIDRPLERFTEAAAFWTAVTGTDLSERRGERGEFATLLPAEGDSCLRLQGVLDGGGTHLDFHVEDVAGAVRKAVGSEASVVADMGEWSVLRSPAGQAFCAVPWEGDWERPRPVAGPGGAESVLDQVTIDVGPRDYEREVEFWAAVTGWELRPTGRPEFRRLRSVEGMPIQIVLQRLDEERAASAHVDLACADIEATRMWHEEHGAQAVGGIPGCTVMRDPVGGVYCLTGRDPRTGLRP